MPSGPPRWGGEGGCDVGHCALWTIKVGGWGCDVGHCALWTTKVGGEGGRGVMWATVPSGPPRWGEVECDGDGEDGCMAV